MDKPARSCTESTDAPSMEKQSADEHLVERCQCGNEDRPAAEQRLRTIAMPTRVRSTSTAMQWAQAVLLRVMFAVLLSQSQLATVDSSP